MLCRQSLIDWEWTHSPLHRLNRRDQKSMCLQIGIYWASRWTADAVNGGFLCVVLVDRDVSDLHG